MRTRSPAAGFTLIELIVVLMLISLIAGIAAVAFTGRLGAGQLDAAARSLAAAMRQARAQAAMQGETQTVLIDVANRTYGIEGRTSRALPAAVTVSVAEPAGGGDTADSTYRIAFNPIGSIQGGTVILSSGRRSVMVRPDPVVAAVIEQKERNP